jgi:alanine racemase
VSLSAGEPSFDSTNKASSVPCFSRVSVDCKALAENWKALKALSQPGLCAGVVKANAYGLGLKPVVTTLWEAGCKVFFVALPQEALALRALYQSAIIYVLNGYQPEAQKLFLDHHLRPCLNTIEEVENWASLSHHEARPLPCALHVNTGMNRLGLSLAEAEALSYNIELKDALDIKLVMSHPASADTPDHPLNALQQERFEHLARFFPGCPLSLANSAATLQGGRWKHDLTRPGIALYGGRALQKGANPMANVVTFEARLLQTFFIRKGETVGYGGEETARQDMILGTVAAGYADGFPRLCGSGDDHGGARAVFCGPDQTLYDAPLMGRISMDLITLDLTHVPEALRRNGTMVELIGPHVRLDEVAGHAQTIGYEILTRLGPRSHFVYLNRD